MNSLSKEQLTELTERINGRFAEFDVEGSRVFEWVIFVLVNYTPVSVDFATALKAATPDDLREAMAGFDQEEKHWRARLDALNGRYAELMTPDPRIARAREGMELITASRAWVRDNYLELTGLEVNTLAYWRDTSEMLGKLESLVDILEGKEVNE